MANPIGYTRQIVQPGTDLYDRINSLVGYFSNLKSDVERHGQGIEEQNLPSSRDIIVPYSARYDAYPPSEVYSRTVIRLYYPSEQVLFRTEIIVQYRGDSWQDERTIEVGDMPWDMSLSYLFDLDGDGDRDIVMRFNKNGPMTVFYNQTLPSTRHVRGRPTAMIGGLPGTYPVTCGGGFGTAFLVAVKGGSAYLLTAGHVVDAWRPGEAQEIPMPTSSPLRVTVVKRDEKYDLALIKVDAQKLLLPPGLGRIDIRPLSIASKVEEGDGVGIWGFGPGVTVGGRPVPNKYPGLAIYFPERDQTSFVVDFPAGPGTSGGPVVNQRGQVAGLAIAAERGHSTFCVGPGAIREFLRKNLP